MVEREPLGMAKKTNKKKTKKPKNSKPVNGDATVNSTAQVDLVEQVGGEEGPEEDVVQDGTLVCALTGEHKTASPQEETLQSFIEQLHGEYGVDLADMERDVRVECI